MGDKITYSIIFLHYDPDNRMEDSIKKCFANIVSMAYGGYEIVHVRDVEGYAHAVNDGMRRSKGKYMFLCNSDIEIHDKQWLEKLAIENTITSYDSHLFYMTGEWMLDGSLYCIPRSVYESLGEMDESFGNGYGCDEIDYWFRAKEAGISMKVIPMNIEHHQNKTYQEYFKDKKEEMTGYNASLFKQKWSKYL